MTQWNARRAAAGALAILLLAAGVAQRGATGQTAERPLVSRAQYDAWFEELSNWGRWGPDDELGALNLITPAKRREAAGLVAEGFTVSLASIANTERSIDNPCPVEWRMLSASPGGASDTVNYACIHGPGTTHIDGFAHRFFDGRMWNGYPIDELVSMDRGAAKNAILTMRHLEAWEARTGVRATSPASRGWQRAPWDAARVAQATLDRRRRAASAA